MLGLGLSPQRIYQHIQADRQAGGTLYYQLRHGQKKCKQRTGKAEGRGQIKGRVSIDERPAIVEEKSRIGDWKIDLVMDTLSDTQIRRIMDRLNHRPRKGLAFQTPHEVLCKETGGKPGQLEMALTS